MATSRKIEINERKVYIGSRYFLQVSGNKVVLSDGSTIDPKDWTVVNKNPDQPITFDVLPAGFEEVTVKEPTDQFFDGSKLKLSGLTQDIKITTHNSNQILVKACFGVHAKRTRTQVLVTPVEIDNAVSIVIDTASTFRSLFSFFKEIVSSKILINALFEEDEELEILVPADCEILVENCENVTVDGVKKLTVNNDLDANIDAGTTKAINVSAGGNVSIEGKDPESVDVDCDGHLDLELNSVNGDVLLEVAGELTMTVAESVNNLTAGSDSDANITLKNCEGKVSITTLGSAELSMENAGSIKIDSESDTNVEFKVCGDLEVETNGVLYINGEKVNGKLDTDSQGCDSTIELEKLNGPADIAGADIELTINGGEIIELEVNADNAQINVYTHVEALRIFTEGDCNGFVASCHKQKLSVSGDCELEIG